MWLLPCVALLSNTIDNVEVFIFLHFFFYLFNSTETRTGWLVGLDFVWLCYYIEWLLSTWVACGNGDGAMLMVEDKRETKGRVGLSQNCYYMYDFVEQVKILCLYIHVMRCDVLCFLFVSTYCACAVVLRDCCVHVYMREGDLYKMRTSSFQQQKY